LEKGADVRYYDPFVPSIEHEGWGLESVPELGPEVQNADCVVIITDHEAVDYAIVAQDASLIFDTRNVMGSNGFLGDNIVRM
jgi:UDP-N-acetyl-D-glucosamine dehydrogenase